MHSDAAALVALFQSLDAASRQSLLDYAAFLQSRLPDVVPAEPVTPVLVTPPLDETVIGALKRLRQSYAMLETNKVFHQASALVSAHVMQGRPTDEVIADLEKLFADHYQSYLRDNQLPK